MSNNFPGGNMKSPQIVIAVLFIALCVMNGCKQDNFPVQPSTPNPPPQIGSGVLTANIDGSPWAAQDSAGIPSGTSTYSGNILHISGVRAVGVDTARENDGAETIDLIIDLTASKAILGPGTYELGTIPAQEGEAQYHDALSCVCATNSTHSGTVTITVLDASRKVVSGTFAFNGIGANGQTHTFSEGMFDVRWK
jgi:hypothetical protein